MVVALTCMLYHAVEVWSQRTALKWLENIGLISLEGIILRNMGNLWPDRRYPFRDVGCFND